MLHERPTSHREDLARQLAAPNPPSEIDAGRQRAGRYFHAAGVRLIPTAERPNLDGMKQIGGDDFGDLPPSWFRSAENIEDIEDIEESEIPDPIGDRLYYAFCIGMILFSASMALRFWWPQ